MLIELLLVVNFLVEAVVKVGCMWGNFYEGLLEVVEVSDGGRKG